MDIEDATCLIAKFDDVWLWHKRLCHVNLDNLISINHMKRVRGFSKLKKLDNAICKLGKMTKSSFKSKTYTSKEILEIVHTDLCGPIEVQSYKGDKYIMLFIDEYTRMMIVMFLK